MMVAFVNNEGYLVPFLFLCKNMYVQKRTNGSGAVGELARE